MTDEKFEDWSPASVFGATVGEPVKQARQWPSTLDRNSGSSSSQDGDVCGSASPPMPLQRKRRANADASPRENQAASPTARDEEKLVSITGPERRHVRTEETELLSVAGDTSTDEYAPTSSAHRQSRRSGSNSSSNNRSRHRTDTNQLAMLMQAEESDRAARVLQKYARLLLLVRREQEAVKEVTALRRMLTQAAVAQVVQCYRRYRSRLAIEAYLSSWREQEAQVRKLLRHAQATKHAREARTTDLKAQRYQEQRRKASLSFVASWCAMRIRIRQQRRAKRRAKIAEAQRRIVCWYRRRSLELRCRGRAQKARQNHRAVLRIQQQYRTFRSRRAQPLARCHAASRAIAGCIRRFTSRKKLKRQQLEAQCALRIQIFYRQVKRMRGARQELELRRRVRRGSHLISALLSKRGVKRAYARWLAVCTSLQRRERERCDTSIRLVQHVIRAFAARKRRIRRHESAICIQRLVRGHQARLKYLALRRQRYKVARTKRKDDAATAIQAHFRGFLARQRFATLRKKLKDRFRCINCGVIEPSGAYCKLCGRKRTNFDLSSADKRLLLLSISDTSSSNRKPEHGSGRSTTGGGPMLPLHLTPMRPASPPSFPKLQASKNAKIHVQMARRAPIMSSNQQEPESVSLLAVSGLSSLPMVLSPRHTALSNITPAKQPTSNRPPPTLLLVARTPEANQAEQFAFPSRPPPKAANQTKVRAQALVHIQSQQQELSQTHALTQHLHRLQKASHAVSRSR